MGKMKNLQLKQDIETILDMFSEKEIDDLFDALDQAIDLEDDKESKSE
jgi:uncharacterized protein (DUF433 family)